jgi:hypothetical protein
MSLCEKTIVHGRHRCRFEKQRPITDCAAAGFSRHGTLPKLCPMATALQRGTTFELQLRRLFEVHGYRAMHNVRLTGRSGAEHQIDVLAELPLPLQTVRLIVEAKAYEQPVDKDALLKLTQIVDDLGADRGVLATTSYFTPGALKMAAGRNVDLWDRDHVSRLLGEAALGLADDGADEPAAAVATSDAGLLGVIPRVSLPEARATVEDGVARRRKGGLLGVGKVNEELAEIALVYATFYELTLDAPVYEEERRGLLAKEVVRKIVPVRLSVGAHSGRIVTIDLAGRVQGTPYTLPELAADEADALKALPQGWFTRDDLLALGYPQGKARIVTGLQAKGLLTSQRLERKVRYSLTGLIPIPNGFRAITEAFAAEPLRQEPTLMRGAARSQAGIVRAAEALAPGATVTRLTVLYYPYYGYTLQRLDGVAGRGSSTA